MEQLELRLSIPFRLDGQPDQWPGCIFHYNNRLKALYTDALIRELAAAANGEEAQIGAVTLEGCFFLLEYEQLMEIARTIRGHFSLAERVIWRAHCEPGRLSTGVLNFCKNVGFYELCIDYRTSSPDEARALGFPPAYTEMQHTKQVLDHSVFRRFSLLLEEAGCNQTDAVWKETLREAAGFGPMAIRLPATIAKSRWEAAMQRLAAADYKPLPGDPSIFVKQGMEFESGNTQSGILGCGLGAVTRLDGLACQNTNDLELYLQASADFTKIAQPLPEAPDKPAKPAARPLRA